jgi:hypothetical protein
MLVLAYKHAAKGVVIVPQALEVGDPISEFDNYRNFCNELERDGWEKTYVEDGEEAEEQ